MKPSPSKAQSCPPFQVFVNKSEATFRLASHYFVAIVKPSRFLLWSLDIIFLHLKLTLEYIFVLKDGKSRGFANANQSSSGSL